MPQQNTVSEQENTDFASGQTGERLAESFLEKRDQSHRSAIPALEAEIDLIGYDEDVLCFVEVKSQNNSSIPPQHQVSTRKQAHLYGQPESICKSTSAAVNRLAGLMSAVEQAATQPDIEWFRVRFWSEFDVRRFFRCSHTHHN